MSPSAKASQGLGDALANANSNVAEK